MQEHRGDRFQIALVKGDTWQVFDLRTGKAAQIGGLWLNNMSEAQARWVCVLLNEEDQDDLSPSMAPNPKAERL